MIKALIPYAANLLLSEQSLQFRRFWTERWRQWKRQPHVVTVYLALNDPYSYLLLQGLEELQERFEIHYEFRTVLNMSSEMFPAPRSWEQNARQDGRYIADLYGFSFPQNPPPSSPERDANLTAQLLHWELQPGYLTNALALFQAYWENDEKALEQLTNPAICNNFQCYRHHLAANETLRAKRGHYLSAMLHYGGEWYWGLNRLQHLEQRFFELELHRDSNTEIRYNQHHAHFLQRMDPTTLPAFNPEERSPIEVFWSLRSPYSYLGLVRIRQLAEHYQVPLVVKPVLPMLMRRMQVPRRKSSYIIQDVAREARLLEIPFGHIADPLGKGVERCYALYEWAQSEGKGVEFLESCAKGAWSEGLRLETDLGLQFPVEEVGLSWHKAQKLLNDDSWKIWAQDNLAELYGNQLWGVPSFKYEETCTFGQDRIDRIEQAIVESLQKTKEK